MSITDCGVFRCTANCGGAEVAFNKEKKRDLQKKRKKSKW